LLKLMIWMGYISSLALSMMSNAYLYPIITGIILRLKSDSVMCWNTGLRFRNMTDTQKLRTALLRAAFAHTKSLSFVREWKRIFDEREFTEHLALKLEGVKVWAMPRTG